MKTAALALTALSLVLGACAADQEGDDFDDSYYYGDDALDGKADTVKTGRFETFVSDDGQYYFQLLATNGEKVLASQGYSSRAAAEDGIATVRFNGMDAEAYQLLQAKDGQWYFNLMAGNWE